MGDTPTPTGATWAQAADALAQRVNRRNRLGTLGRRVGLGLLAGAGLALLWRLLGPATFLGLPNTGVVLGLLGIGLATGVALAVCATCGEPEVRADDAAWALDRIARADGRGLAAAAAHGPAASEAAFAGDALAAPPSVRLLPPRGVVMLAAGCLVGALAVVVPPRHAPDDDRSDTERFEAAAAATGAEADAAAVEAEAKAARLDARAQTAKAVRDALNLPPEGPLDPEEVTRRLSDERVRAAAAKAAGTDPALAEALAAAEPSGEGLAGLLDPSEDNRERAETHRRDAVGARARTVGPIVPASRRDVVKRYLELID